MARFPAAASWAAIFVLVLWVGCSRSNDKTSEVLGPPLYGNAESKPAPVAERLRPTGAPTSDEWRNAPFYVLQTELSPATLIFSTNKYMSLFTGLDQYGLGAPSHLAFATRNGPRAYTNGTRVVADDMDESWLLLWFVGAKGWTNWDTPWAVFLQHKPASMKLDAEGLHLSFRGGAEHIVMMPLYGYYKPPPKGVPSSKKITTWKWAEVLTKDVLMRIRYWASAAREFPIYCEDSFSIDRSKDVVTIGQRFQWISTRDDWNTKAIKVAPLPPPLALAVNAKQFPAEFSAPVMDLDYFTPYGPYKGIEAVDQYDVSLRVLKYVNETALLAAPSDKITPREDRLEELWAHAHFSNDWDFIRQRWDAIRKGFSPRAQIRWVGFGRDGVVEFADQAPPCVAIARMAYRIGDLDMYNYACCIFARELVLHYVKQGGAEYFRKHQPWHTMESMEGAVYLTKLLGENAGWHIDGPKYPADADTREFNRLWIGSTNADLARFRDDYVFTQPGTRIRTARYQRLIPPAPPTPFTVGIQRDVAGPNPDLLAKVEWQSNHWPRLSWGKSWKTPSGDRWNFGHIVSGTGKPPAEPEVVPLNWNSRILIGK